MPADEQGMGEHVAAETLTLRPGKAKLCGLLAVCALFAASGAFMVRAGKAGGWFVLGGFGLGGAALALQLLPGASYLALSPEGFVMRSLFRSWRIPWRDVESFGVGVIAGRRFVTFSFSHAHHGQEAVRAAAQALGGAEAMLPDTYGLPAEELARLLNEWRLRAPS